MQPHWLQKRSPVQFAKRVQVQDDSFWLWDANTLSLLKKLEPAVPGSSQPACRVFCVSQDGAWMVAGGTSPLLFVWDLAASELLYALHLPFGRSVYGTSQLHFMPDSQTVAGNSAAALTAAQRMSAETVSFALDAEHAHHLDYMGLWVGSVGLTLCQVFLCRLQCHQCLPTPVYPVTGVTAV